MKLKINKKDCLVNKLKIPIGYRIIEDWELLRELRTNKELQEIFKKGIWVMRRSGIRSSWINDHNHLTYFDAEEYSNYGHNCLRGVFITKYSQSTWD